jgi:hypothetical protein
MDIIYFIRWGQSFHGKRCSGRLVDGKISPRSDEVTSPLPGANEAISFEKLICGSRGVHRDARISGRVPDGRDPIARFERAGLDERTIPLSKYLLLRHRAMMLYLL